jgi:hypothetical protein
MVPVKNQIVGPKQGSGCPLSREWERGRDSRATHVENGYNGEEFCMFTAFWATRRYMGGQPMTSVSQKRKSGITEIVHVVKNHEFALAMDHGAWRLVDSQGKDVR